MVNTIRITRNQPYDIPIRPVIDNHKPHDDCLFDLVEIPTKQQEAWFRALQWHPKTEGWAHTFDQALRAVLEGSRPLLYGWPDNQIRTAATIHNLEIIDLGWISVAFHPQNRSIAELLEWSHKQPLETKHIVNGVALGYPLAAVETWVRMKYPGPTMEEMLEKTK
jgi:hypothetical protein